MKLTQQTALELKVLDKNDSRRQGEPLQRKIPLRIRIVSRYDLLERALAILL